MSWYWPFGSKRKARRKLGRDPSRSDRLNNAYYESARDVGVNSILSSRLSTLRARAQQELLYNPVVQGLVKTHRDDVVGDRGPDLQVSIQRTSGRARRDGAYADRFEELWRRWFSAPDLNGRFSGIGLLRQNDTQLWTMGEYLNQMVFADVPNESGLRTRVLAIQPRRLTDPLTLSDDVTLGIRHDRAGKPLSYFIEEADVGDTGRAFTNRHVEVPADQMVHGYQALDPEQLRGFPWLTTALDLVQQVEDYKQATIVSMRMAASLAVLLSSEEDENEPISLATTGTLEPGTITALPPGYTANQITPSQPTSQFKPVTDLLYAQMGRSVGMPMGTVLLNHSGHNFSSARLDRDIYHAGIRVTQRDFEFTLLNPLADAVRREGELRGLLPVLPDGAVVRYEWAWPVFRSIDPVKDATAASARMESGISSGIAECLALGKDPDRVISERKRWAEMEEENDLTSSLPSQPTDEDDDGDDEPVRTEEDDPLARRNGLSLTNGRAS